MSNERVSNSGLDVRRWAFELLPIKATPAPPAAPFRRSLLAWYRRHGRDLPWRRTRDPYAVLVSEFMLQQTQVATVIPYYNEWMQRFPDFAALAAASEQEVLHAWQGLGYYARARNLRATARAVMEKHGGSFPRGLEAIQALPGIGRYTANAIATFAFDQSVPIVEANIARLLARLLDLQVPIDTGTGREALWSRAAALLPGRAAGVYNSALMDLGALVCSVRPKCKVCPVRSACAATNPSLLPRKKARPALRLLAEHHSFAVRRRHVLLEQSQDRWRGMWMLPRLAKPPASAQPLHSSEFPFTNHRITLTVFGQVRSPRPANPFQRWFSIDALDSLPLPSPHRRALHKLLRATAHRLS
jgi:A/G-specific adenine glycosylase